MRHKRASVDMVELIRDNLEVLQRGALQDLATTSSQSKWTRREIPDLLRWVQCFGTYMAIVASKQPDRIKQLLAYQTVAIKGLEAFDEPLFLSPTLCYPNPLNRLYAKINARARTRTAKLIACDDTVFNRVTSETYNA